MLQKSKLIAFIIMATLSVSFAQEKPMQMRDSTKSKMKMHGMKNMKENKKDTSSIVRKGSIDLNDLDANKDGKIFQCPMEVNVISDSKGECPECGMKLREISIKDAEAKLLKRGFEVKESGKEEKPESMNEETSLKIWNKVCPVQGEEVDPETPTAEYKGKVIGFCCPGCDAKFKKDPEKYIKNLSEDGTKFITTK